MLLHPTPGDPRDMVGISRAWASRYLPLYMDRAVRHVERYIGKLPVVRLTSAVVPLLAVQPHLAGAMHTPSMATAQLLAHELRQRGFGARWIPSRDAQQVCVHLTKEAHFDYVLRTFGVPDPEERYRWYCLDRPQALEAALNRYQLLGATDAEVTVLRDIIESLGYAA